MTSITKGAISSEVSRITITQGRRMFVPIIIVESIPIPSESSHTIIVWTIKVSYVVDRATYTMATAAIRT